MKLKTIILSSLTSLLLLVSCSSETDETAKNEVQWTDLLGGGSLELWKSHKSEELLHRE